MDRMPRSNSNSVDCEDRVEHLCALCETFFQPLASAGTGVCPQCVFGLALTPSTPILCEMPVRASDSNPTSVFGSYSVVEEIGRGGMGVIYRAVHCNTGEIVALKTVLPQYANCPETLARFEREAEAAASLIHPHSMPVFEVGRATDGKPFFTMLLAAGGSLNLLGEKYRGRWRQIAELLIKIAGAIEHAHAQGLLHRDIKPSNILFTADQEPLISDFGLAKPMHGLNDLTQSFAVIGTPNYLSPEQATGQTKHLTQASDIYSVGAVFFELLTGRPPFVGDNPLQIIQDVSRKKALRPRMLAPLIPSSLENICIRCLERYPDDRYAKVGDLASDLENWLNGHEITPQPLYKQWWKRVRRLPVASFWCMGTVSAVLIAAATYLWVLDPPFKHEHMTSIAVAIDDLGQDRELEELAQRATASLKAAFSASSAFQVADSNSFDLQSGGGVFDPLKYGRAIHAETVLTGCVRRAGDHIRLVTRLLRCDTGEVVWHHTSALPSQQLQSKLPTLMETVYDTLQNAYRDNRNPEFPPSVRVPQPEALVFYTKAMELADHGNRRDLEAAVELLRRACTLNPHFAQARAMLAFSLWTQANNYGKINLLPAALSTAREALLEDVNCAQAHRVVASCLYKAGRYAEALDDFWSGVELDPQSAGCAQSLGMCLRALGRIDEAIPWLKRATQLAPARGTLFASLAETLILCGADYEAEDALKHAAELDSDRPIAQIDLSALRTWQKKFQEARELCADVRSRFPDTRYGLYLAAWIEFCDQNVGDSKILFETLRAENSYQRDWEFYGAINPSSALAYLALRAGLAEQAHALADEAIAMDRELLNQFPNNPRILHDLSATFSMIGDLHEAQHFLESSIAAGWVEHRSTQIDPRFANILSDPLSQKMANTTLSHVLADESTWRKGESVGRVNAH